nr:hypothetical protein [Tanacetum cinerariifolium]
MIVDSIKNGPYVRLMTATPGEPDLPFSVPESFHEQTDEELTENDLKRMDADDQAIKLFFWAFLKTNQFGQYAGQVAQNQQRYNAWQNGGIQGTQNAVQNAGVHSGGNQNGLLVIPVIANQNGIGNVVAARAKGTGNRNQARHIPLNKDNYVPWWSRIIRYAMSRPNGKMIVDFIKNGPYVRRMIATSGEPNLPVPVLESFHEQTDEELKETDIKRMDADDQAIQTILLGLPEDVYAAVDSCETAKEMWERVRQMMKGSHIGEQEKKAKLFNEWETDFTQIYDFLKMNQEEVNELRAERLAKSHDLLALMAYSQNSFNFPTTYKDQSSSSNHPQQSFPINNKYNPQPALNQNFMQPPMTSLEDINDSTEAMNGALILFAKAFQLSATSNNNQRTTSNPRNLAQNQQGYNAWQNGGIQGAQNTGQNAGVQNGGNQNRLVVVLGIANQSRTGNVVAARAEGTGIGNQAWCYNCRGLGYIERNYTARSRRRDAAYLQTRLLIAQKEETLIQLQAEEFDFMAAAGDLDEIEEEEQYTDLLEPILEPQLVPQNDNHVTSVSPSMEDKFLDKEVDLEARIKDLENILLKRDQTVQTMHMLNPIPDSFYHSNQKMALGYPNPSYLKKAQLKQQGLYNGNLLLEEHDPPVVYDLKETLELAQESREKLRFLKKEIKPANYAKINHLSGVFVPQMTKSKEELFLSNISNMVTVSKTISIPNEDLLDDTTLSVAQKFLNEVKSSLVTLTQVDARVQNFEIQFLQKAAKFVRDFKSPAKEADESLDMQKYLELEIERLLKASVSHDIMSIVQNGFVDAPSDLRTELDQCKYDKISYDKAYTDMQQKVERLQAQLRDLKGKSSDTPSASNTLDPLNQKLESKIVELEFQVVNNEREISHLKTTYKNLFDSIKSNRAHAKLHDLIYENAQLRARGFKNTSESMKNTSRMSVTPHVDKPKLSVVTPLSKKLHASMASHYVPQPREFNVVKHRNYTLLELEGKGNTRNARFPSASKSSDVKKNVTVEEHHRTLLLSKNQKTMSYECNNIKLDIRNDKSKIICANYKQCLVTANHDACLLSSVNALNSRANKLCANVPLSANQKRHRAQVWNPKQVGSKERLAIKPRLPRLNLKWSPSGCSFDLKGKLVAFKETNCPNDDKACTSNPQEPMRKQFPNSTVFLGRNDHIAAILGYDDLKWGNITITRVYFVEGTLASLEIWMVLTCSKAIVLQISTPSISMTWPQLHLYVSWPVQLLLSRGYGINDNPTSTSTPSTT